MLKKYTYFIFTFTLTLILVSCHNDVGEINPNTEQSGQITVPLVFGEVEGNLFGYVFDDENNPISNANVSIYSSQTTTNEYGVFNFKDTNLDPQGTFIKVEKSGYLIGSDMVYPNSSGKGTSRIKLLKVLNEESFQASEGGVVEIVGGGQILFSPSSLIRSNGSIYDGVVKSSAYRLSPLDHELGLQMAGGLLGFDKTGRHRVLSTYGMLAVELRGFDNQILRLKSDKTATLTFPIEDEMQSSVGSDVPAWNFDFQDGLWHEANTTSNDKQNFTTTIHSLGFWNLAIPSGMSQLCGKLVYTNELPAKNYVVQIINNGLPTRIGITDLDGYFCGKVPIDENLKFQVLHPTCGEILKEFFGGPFEEVGTMGDVVLEVDEKYISGSIECNGALIDNATIIIESENNTNVYFPNANGTFNVNIDEITCGSASLSIFAYDNTTEIASETQEVSTDNIEALNLEICSVICVAEGEFVYEKDDYCLDGEYSRVSIKMTNGSGDYAYEWPDGSTGEFVNNPLSGNELCVKVVDQVTACEYTFCDDVKSFERLGIETLYSSNTECFITSGFIVLDVVGGKEPINYKWEGPEGYSSTDKQLENVSSGTYTVTILDGGDCEVIESVDVYDVTTPIKSDIEDFCDVSIITIEENDGYQPYTYTWSAGEAIDNQLFVYNPGAYSLTVTDANMCSRSVTLTIFEAGSLPVIDPTYNCEGGVVTFTELESGYEYYYQPFGTNDKIPVVMEQGDVEVAILETGYRFELGSQNPDFSNCDTSESIELPRFDGLQIGSITSASCGGCTDGHIEYDVLPDEDCFNCTPGEVIVIRAEDYADVTALNDNNELENGEYYVVVLDDNSECYIAHALVVLEL